MCKTWQDVYRTVKNFPRRKLLDYIVYSYDLKTAIVSQLHPEYLDNFYHVANIYDAIDFCRFEIRDFLDSQFTDDQLIFIAIEIFTKEFNLLDVYNPYYRELCFNRVMRIASIYDQTNHCFRD